MFTVTAAMQQLTDPAVVLKKLTDTLGVIDPNFKKEKQMYVNAVKALVENLDPSFSTSAREYIDAIEQKISAQLVYAFWLGFQQNLLCFQNPINAMFLQTDHEDFLRERRMHTLPDVQKANQTINTFIATLRTLSGEKLDLTEDITNYVCYLETIGLKLAHYCGFIFADKFLEHVIPGYSSDTFTTITYKMLLEKYLQVDLDPLE